MTAKPVPVLVDQEMDTRLFLVDEKFIKGILTLERVFCDSAAGAYCHWKNEGRVEEMARDVGEVRNLLRENRALKPADLEQFAGGLVLDFNERVPGARLEKDVDTAKKVVTERRMTGPNNFNIVSAFKRVWDFNAGTVKLSTKEGYKGRDPYIEGDLGVYDIPDNDYAKKIEALLER